MLVVWGLFIIYAERHTYLLFLITFVVVCIFAQQLSEKKGKNKNGSEVYPGFCTLSGFLGSPGSSCWCRCRRTLTRSVYSQEYEVCKYKTHRSWWRMNDTIAGHFKCSDICFASYLYVVSTLRLAATKSAGGIQTGRLVPGTHLVHSNKPGSTRIFVLVSCWRPETDQKKRR